VKWRVTLSGPAQRDLKRLDRQGAARVLAALDRLATTAQGDVKRLEDRDREWRPRMGGVRVIFTYERARQTLAVARILPHGRAYRD
jgi:mRNA-degrading endonuclease RelE of RelBE toxin-antitoxin system